MDGLDFAFFIPYLIGVAKKNSSSEFAPDRGRIWTNT